MNKKFANVCDCFVDNKLLIHFGEVKTKCFLFSRNKNLPELNMTCNNNRIKQYRTVEYLGYCVDANSSGESMTMISLRKINAKFQSYINIQNEFQPHFDYAYISWYPLISQKIRNKLQVPQNKCIRFCLKLNPRQHIGAKEFKETNWFSTKEREQRMATKAFSDWKGTSPFYVNKLYVPSRNTHNTRSHMALPIPFTKSNLGQS